MQIRIVGDVHGKQDQYINLVKDCEVSVQLGDMGFNYDRIQVLDGRYHRVLFGNHDKLHTDDDGQAFQDDIRFFPNYGAWIVQALSEDCKTNIPPMFFVRGEHSIDKANRTEGINWFENEQLTYREMSRAFEYYRYFKPEIMITHGCPSSIIPYVANPAYAHLNIKPSATAKLLQAMYEEHQPKLWLFGHFHRSKLMWPNKDTYFFCIDELDHIDLVDTPYGYDVKSGYFDLEIVNGP
jgi:predicted phosphodiesterase